MKKDPEQLKLLKKDKSPEGEKEKKPREKKVDYEGSRWSSLVLLGITVLVGFFLYLTGNH